MLDRGIQEYRIRDYPVKPENDIRKPCGKLTGKNKIKIK
jgi:hypothetical protein